MTISSDLNTTAFLRAGYVSANTFEVLGLPLQAGRPFREEDRTAGEAVVLVGERLADVRLGGASNV